MSRARLRSRLAPQIAAALILSSLGACCCDECCTSEDEQVVTMDQLPPRVSETLNREAGGGKIVEVERCTDDGKTTYSADIEKDGKTWDITIAEDGTVISREED